MKKGKVLIIDDETLILSMMNRFLSMLQIDAIFASAPDAAIQLVREHLENVEVAVVDLFLSGESGIELVKSIKELKKDVYIVMTSGDPLELDMVIKDCADQIVNKTLSKPFTFEDVKKLFRELEYIE